MKLTAIPILVGAMFSGVCSSAALRRWADRGDANHGWCSTLSRDHRRELSPSADSRRDNPNP